MISYNHFFKFSSCHSFTKLLSPNFEWAAYFTFVHPATTAWDAVDAMIAYIVFYCWFYLEIFTKCCVLLLNTVPHIFCIFHLSHKAYSLWSVYGVHSLSCFELEVIERSSWWGSESLFILFARCFRHGAIPLFTLYEWVYPIHIIRHYLDIFLLEPEYRGVREESF